MGIRKPLFAWAFALGGFAAATAQGQELPPNFDGTVVYEGSYAGALTRTTRLPANANARMRAIAGRNARQETLSGKAVFSVRYAGTRVTGTVSGTGELSSGSFTGTRSGSQCRIGFQGGGAGLFHCDRNRFSGKSGATGEHLSYSVDFTLAAVPSAGPAAASGDCPPVRQLEAHLRCERERGLSRGARQEAARAQQDDALRALIRSSAATPVPGIEGRIAAGFGVPTSAINILPPLVSIRDQHKPRIVRLYPICDASDRACAEDPAATLTRIAIHDSATDRLILGRAEGDKAIYCNGTVRSCIPTPFGPGRRWSRNAFSDYMTRMDFVLSATARANRRPDSASVIRSCLATGTEGSSWIVRQVDGYGTVVSSKLESASWSTFENKCDEALIIDVDGCSPFWYMGPVRIPARTRYEAPLTSPGCSYYALTALP
jgi:hypothetical protein